VKEKIMIKLLMNWDIKSGQEQAYSEFVVKELVPSMTQMGLHLTEAWHTLYGEGPQIMVGGVTEDLESMQQILSSDDWQKLHQKLQNFVANYSHKVIRASNRFQL